MAQENLKLKLFIKESGYNNTTFAKKIGYSRVMVSAWVGGTKPPSKAALYAIAQEFNREPHQLNGELGFNLVLPDDELTPIEKLTQRVAQLEARLYSHLDEAESIAANYVLGLLFEKDYTALDVLIGTTLTAKTWKVFCQTGKISDSDKENLLNWLQSLVDFQVEIPTEDSILTSGNESFPKALQ